MLALVHQRTAKLRCHTACWYLAVTSKEVLSRRRLARSASRYGMWSFARNERMIQPSRQIDAMSQMAVLSLEATQLSKTGAYEMIFSKERRFFNQFSLVLQRRQLVWKNLASMHTFFFVSWNVTCKYWLSDEWQWHARSKWWLASPFTSSLVTCGVRMVTIGRLDLHRLYGSRYQLYFDCQFTLFPFSKDFNISLKGL